MGFVIIFDSFLEAFNWFSKKNVNDIGTSNCVMDTWTEMAVDKVFDEHF